MRLPNLCTCLAAAWLLVGCDSASPSSHTIFRFSGIVTLDGHPPDPNTVVWLAASQTPFPGYDITRAAIDSLGQFTGVADSIGPVVDTLVLTALQYACDNSPGAAVHLTNYRLPAHRDFTLHLSAGPPAATLVRGLEMCGALDGYPVADDLMFVALVLDSLADSVFGRYAINHLASIGTPSGTLAGLVADDTLRLSFHPSQTTACSGITLSVPIDPNGTLGLATLSGTLADACYVYSGRFRMHPHAYGFPPP